ncbi:ATPase, histidine kinase-, DNA gyrase B-, and HSP90-like domain protein [Verrucomicrobiia bacterium DG1235]|nr:ATPase, histidine kinase-, DNA gyrase B-, and HSP90-like domain protein [Verrucomicrobiae bacterium DG1235]
MKIRAKVYLGFGIVVAMVFGIAYMGRHSINEIVFDFKNFDQDATRTLQLSQLDGLAEELNGNVQMYIFTGYDGMVQKARFLEKEIDSRINALLSRETDEESLGYLSKMKEHLGTYMENFESAIVERRLRSEYVDKRLVDDFAILSGMLQTFADQDVSDVATGEAFRKLYQMRRAAADYFKYLDTSLVNEAKERVLEVKQAMANMPGGSAFATEVAIGTFVESLDTYEADFLRAVQATRAYLFLVNVVMAGQSSEFSYNVEALKVRGFESLHELRNKTFAAADDRRKIVLWLTLVAAMGALVASVLVARSTVGPITSITDVLRRLASGDKKASFDASARNDEIGTMAEAAEVFRKKNLETEGLLEESERMRGELDAKTGQLERANEEMESFVYTVSHDLKSPIVTSQGFIGMMRELKEMGEPDEAFAKLGQLEKANARMVELIHHLLDLSRVGKVDVEVEEVELSPLVDEIVESYEQKIAEEGFEVRVQPNLPAVSMNRVRLSQVIDNLIGNALKYGHSLNGNPNVIEIEAKETGDAVELYVRDLGIGVDPAYHEKVFGLFNRLDVSKPGSGVGLSIVRKTMRSFGGDVWLDSALGKGATFRLSFARVPTLAYEI